METKVVDLPSEGDSWQILLEHLAGKIFHVTPQRNLESIIRDGVVKTNQDRSLPTWFGGGEGYFRNRNCVSFYDYRMSGSKQWSEHYDKCLPVDHLTENSPIAVLFLSDSSFDKLKSWEDWQREQAWGERVVPYIEIGHRGPVPIQSIASILIVRRPDGQDFYEKYARLINETVRERPESQKK